MRNYFLKVLPFPIKGVNVVSPRGLQPDLTCVNALNVRPFDLIEDRARGGIRPGLDLYLTNTFDGGGRIQDINFVSIIKDAAPNTSALYVREQRGVALSNGTIQGFTSTGLSSTTDASTNTLQSNAAFVLSTELYGRLYYCDGVNYIQYNGAGDKVENWAADAPGVLPGNPGNTAATNTACRLIETWDGRIVMAGLRSDPNNWFMSAKGDPDDWDYAAAPTTELMAVTGAVGVVGIADDHITSLIPYSDDVLIIGCDKSIWQMQGNPMSGGRIDNVSHNMGTPFGRPWCRDPDGNVYFLSSMGELYRMPPYGAKPEAVSDPIHPLLDSVNLNTTFVRMEWDREAHGCSLWLTPFANTATTHYFWDARTEGWFPFKYASPVFDPIAVKLYDGDNPNDRVILIGCDDGKIRFANTNKVTDSGTAYPATVTFGPIAERGDLGRPQKTIVTGVSARTDINSVNTTYELLVGDTAEQAARSEAATFATGDNLKAGLSVTHNPMKGGYYIYVKVGTPTAAGPWALEEVSLMLETVVTDPGRQSMQ